MNKSFIGLSLLLAACGDDASHTTVPDGGADAGAVHDGASPDGAYESAVYSLDDNWLCLPGKPGDLCHENLDATVLEKGGGQRVEPHEFAKDPAADCFYVYPTISADKTPNSDRVPGTEEENIVKEQAARLSHVCNVYAPVYRQVTLGALAGAFPDASADTLRETAYADVLDAWKHYMATYNRGRPFILMGHSQGAGMLKRLIQERIDGDDALRAKLVSALLIGGGIAVPDGADVGLDFQNIPLCKTADQTGCVVAYSSFRSTAPPPDNSLFGKPRTGSGVVACTNPAALGGGPADLLPYYPTRTGIAIVPGVPDSVTTPYVTLPDLLRGECVVKNGFSYLEVTVQSDSADPRPQDIGGDLTPEWGLHLVDVHVAMGDLVALAGKQIEAMTAQSR